MVKKKKTSIRSDRSDGSIRSVPSSPDERARLRAVARSFAASRVLVPPLPLRELASLATELLAEKGMNAGLREFTMVLLNNEAWRSQVAAIPFSRRTLVLPPCLRSSKSCKALFDELGLLCKHCGACVLSSIQAEAEQLGYSVIVAEGTGVVSQLIRRGVVDAVVGVSCMESLETAFPHTTETAVPGIAIPLLTNGCQDTTADVEWILAELRATAKAPCPHRLDIEALRTTVDSWFAPMSVRAMIGTHGAAAEDIAIAWLSKAGKRWRPLLTACVCQALCEPNRIPDELRAVSIAVECFHKASLVHDDIEDNDDSRYGDETLHKRYGVPVALNAGDLLIGEGYRLIATCGADASHRAAMLSIAAEGHRALCIGQGEELAWMRAPSPLSCEQVLDIFRLKTAPAFGVALRLGAVCGGADNPMHEALRHYSDALGVAYQIKDDLDDFVGGDANDLRALRPSLLCAIAHESAGAPVRKILHAMWRFGRLAARDAARLHRLMADAGVAVRAKDMLHACAASALDALKPIHHSALKSLLFRILHTMLNGGGDR